MLAELLETLGNDAHDRRGRFAPKQGGNGVTPSTPTPAADHPGTGGTTAVERKPPTAAEQQDLADLDSELQDVLDEGGPDFAEEDRQLEAFEKGQGGSYKSFQELQRNNQELRDEANGLAAEKMDILHRRGKEVDDPHADRWKGRTITEDASVAHPDSGSEKFRKARDRYVVADTPTLEMNAALRGERPMEPKLKRRVSEANYLTSGTMRNDSVVSRNMNLSPEVASSMRPGTTWESKSFQSTQTGYLSTYNRNREQPGTIHTSVQLRVPAGTHAGDVGFGEIVLRPGRMRVVSSEWDGEKHSVVAEWESEL